jgi:carbonic anhydrase/acetyltransferase-like protein (isoleucine patch superfamily)
MKKIYLLAISLLIFYFSLFTFSSQASAKVMMQEKGTITISAKETVNDDLFIAGETVEIDGVVTGDVFVAAGSMRVSGDIKGGLFVGTGDLSVTGAKIGGSLVVGSGNVMLDNDATVGGSLVVGSGTFKNSASVGRNILVGSGTIYQNGRVGKEARLGAGTIELGPQNLVAGDLLYTLGDPDSELQVDPSSSVSGSLNRYVEPEQAQKDMAKAKEDFGKAGRMFSKAWMIYSFLSSILIGFIFLKLFPKTMLNLTEKIQQNPLKSLGIGFLMVIAIVPVLLALSFTIIGLPLAGLLLLLFWVDVHVAKLIAAYAFGRFVSAMANLSKPSTYLVFFIGITLFYVLRLIPGLGWLASVAFTWVGLGAIWVYFTSHLKNL